MHSVNISVPLLGGAPLVLARFVARPNQFLVQALLDDGTPVAAHMADRGRLLTLLVPDARLLLGHKPGAHRKTQYQVAGVYTGDQLVSLDTTLPNRLIEAALGASALPQFAHYSHIEREVKIGGSRFDFGLAPAPPLQGKRLGADCPYIVEVKSVGDMQDGVALFPDAPTARGRRHLLELAELSDSGKSTAVIFVVQRSGGEAMAVNRAIDPNFADALSEVAQRGVAVYAYSCPVTPHGIRLGPALPVLL